MKKKRTTKNTPTAQLAVAMIRDDGAVEFVSQSDVRFPGLATAVASRYGSHLLPAFEESPYSRSGMAYNQLLGGSPNLRQLLIPREADFDAILQRIDDYRRNSSWIDRALLLRSQFNASEIAIHAPRNIDQTKWMRQLLRDLRFFSFAREWFWQLRAHYQVVTLWKTVPGGDKPLSIECADLRAHRPKGPGLNPRIVVIPAKVPGLVKLVEESRRSGDTGAKAKAKLEQWPQPLVRALRESTRSNMGEVDAEELHEFGYHLEYTSLSRRHHEDHAFPGIYTIFGDIEMVEMARSVDINALHHYKAAVLLVRIGPQDPRGTDIPVIPTDTHLGRIEKKIMEQSRNKLPTLVTRGDFRIDFVTPPIEVFTPEKYKMAIANIFDWLGIPSVAWAGQDLKGSFASAQTTLKFLQQESKDERDLFREQFERWFYERALSSNAFSGAEWPMISFDPNSLTEQRLIIQTAQLLWQAGVSMSTVLDTLGLDGEVEASRLRDFKQYTNKLGVDFVSRTPQRPSGRPEGRPVSVDQPTPERETSPQPRPSTSAVRPTEDDLT